MNILNWVNVKEKLPEECEELLIQPEDRHFPLKSKDVLVYTDRGDVYKNWRLKMMVGEKEWRWFMGVEGSITYWTIYNKPND